jgi:hypothetical protein
MITPFESMSPSAGNTDALNPIHSYETKSSEFSNRLQATTERLDQFKRLEAGFNRAGWSFYPLTDESFLAVHRKWQLSQVCPDVRAAKSLLRRVGGTA